MEHTGEPFLYLPDASGNNCSSGIHIRVTTTRGDREKPVGYSRGCLPVPFRFSGVRFRAICRDQEPRWRPIIPGEVSVDE